MEGRILKLTPNERKRKFRSKNKKLGLCLDCSSPAFNSGLLCKICRDKHMIISTKWNRNNPEKIILRSAKHRAKKQNVPFLLKLEDINIPEKCPILGIKLEITGKHASPNSPSLDKIIPELGYIKGNIQVISHKANSMKRDATIDELILLGNWAKEWKKEKL